MGERRQLKDGHGVDALPVAVALAGHGSPAKSKDFG